MLDAFLSLVRAALWEQPIASFPKNADWKAIYRMAKQQTVVGMVACGMKWLPEGQKPPQGAVNALEKYMFRNARNHALMNYSLSGLVERYRQDGVEGVLLKGQGVASLYPNPEMRQCGDIDFYVPPVSYPKAFAIAKEMWDKDLEEEDFSKHSEFDKDTIHVELHHTAARMSVPWRNRKLQQWIVEELDPAGRHIRKAEIGGVEVNLPSAEFDALYVFYHIWHHLLAEGIVLRQVCDWTLLLASFKGEIDVDKLSKRLRDFGLLRPWQILGWIAVNKLDLEADAMPLYSEKVRKDGEKVFRAMISGENKSEYDGDESTLMSFYRRKIYLFNMLMRRFFSNFGYSPLEWTFYALEMTSIGLYRSVRRLFS